MCFNPPSNVMSASVGRVRHHPTGSCRNNRSIIHRESSAQRAIRPVPRGFCSRNRDAWSTRRGFWSMQRGARYTKRDVSSTQHGVSSMKHGASSMRRCAPYMKQSTASTRRSAPYTKCHARFLFGHDPARLAGACGLFFYGRGRDDAENECKVRNADGKIGSAGCAGVRS